MLVIDASVLAVGLVDDGPEGARIRERLRGEQLSAPALIELGVASVLRGLVRAARLDGSRAMMALADLQDLPMVRAPHAPLLGRCWELRQNLTIYDASYVALAEAMDVPLITGDRRLARATGPRCSIEVP